MRDLVRNVNSSFREPVSQSTLSNFNELATEGPWSGGRLRRGGGTRDKAKENNNKHIMISRPTSIEDLTRQLNMPTVKTKDNMKVTEIEAETKLDAPVVTISLPKVAISHNKGSWISTHQHNKIHKVKQHTPTLL